MMKANPGSVKVEGNPQTNSAECSYHYSICHKQCKQ